MNESNPTAQTFRDILPVMLGELLLTGIMLGVYALIGRFSAKVLWGALLGAGTVLLNFSVMIFALLRAEKRGSPEKGQLYVKATYALRMLLLAAVLILALKTKVFDPLATALPLCFQPIAVWLFELFRKKGENAQ
ncbi:MAG: ATP synthase subunit I [Firmicutes bacterium]|nr:ATP synthase subunit I [Bacillota bacterium]